MNITDKRLLDANGNLLIVANSVLTLDLEDNYFISYSRLVSDDPDQIWLSFGHDEEAIYDLDGNRYYNFDCEGHITKEEFLDDIRQNHQPLFEWVLWNQLP